jgi:hypothetical protein
MSSPWKKKQQPDAVVENILKRAELAQVSSTIFIISIVQYLSVITDWPEAENQTRPRTV